jgi:hypothetical protein
MTHIICVVLPVHIISEANQRHHWAVKAKRVASHRAITKALLAKHKPPPAGPIKITLTRIAPRALDGDNLQSGFKATRDSVADWLGIDDGDKRLTWLYAQRKGKPLEYSATVSVEWAE